MPWPLINWSPANPKCDDAQRLGPLITVMNNKRGPCRVMSHVFSPSWRPLQGGFEAGTRLVEEGGTGPPLVGDFHVDRLNKWAADVGSCHRVEGEQQADTEFSLRGLWVADYSWIIAQIFDWIVSTGLYFYFVTKRIFNFAKKNCRCNSRRKSKYLYQFNSNRYSYDVNWKILILRMKFIGHVPRASRELLTQLESMAESRGI